MNMSILQHGMPCTLANSISCQWHARLFILYSASSCWLRLPVHLPHWATSKQQANLMQCLAVVAGMIGNPPKQQRVLPSLAEGTSPINLCLVNPNSQASPNKIFSSVLPAYHITCQFVWGVFCRSSNPHSKPLSAMKGRYIHVCAGPMGIRASNAKAAAHIRHQDKNEHGKSSLDYDMNDVNPGQGYNISDNAAA